MNIKLFTSITAAAATALVSISAPAKAATFGTNGIRFEQDTKVEFTFKESHGAYQSALGIYGVSNGLVSKVADLFAESKSSDNGDANEWKGTLGNTVKNGVAAFTFLANQVYSLGLASTYNGSGRGIVYSTSSLNTASRGTQQAVFGATLWDELSKETTNNFQLAGQRTDGLSSLSTGTTISFDDRGNSNDTDFQDFTVTAQTVPEPLTMTGLALGASGMIAARRRRANKSA
jgi:hypothetical protein